MSLSISELEVRRDDLRQQLAQVGDLRPGTLIERYRKCGKPNCHCAQEGDPGHGPVWTLVFRARGKTRNRVIPREAVAQTRTQIAECKRLRRLTSELIEVGEGLCHARLTAHREAGREAKKGALRKRSRRRSGARSSG